MNLMTFLRMSLLLVLAWMMVAVGVGFMGVGGDKAGASTTFFIPSPSLHDAVPTGRPDGPDMVHYQLIDRVTGQIDGLVLPSDPAWSLLSVSPWRDRDGNLEAVGRWVSRREGQDEFCGLGLLSLPQMKVKNRITLDVLPTGKPCWVPGRSGEILFPAGNGQLYRCSVTARSGETLDGKVDPSEGEATSWVESPRQVTWQVQPPGVGAMNLEDPAWSSEPAVRHLVFVSLSVLEQRQDRREVMPSKIWWLVMNDDGDAVVAAGRLTEPDPGDQNDRWTFERMPSVAVGAGGKLELIYLTRLTFENTWRLRSARIMLDEVTALPRLTPGPDANRVVAERLAPASLTVSADGKDVYAIDASGNTVKHPIAR
jgi:hypothetical protein